MNFVNENKFDSLKPGRTNWGDFREFLIEYKVLTRAKNIGWSQQTDEIGLTEQDYFFI